LSTDLSRQNGAARRRRICVIDDDASFRKLARTILNSEGFDCDAVEDLADAAEHVARTNPDLVMMDLRLGQEVDGVQVLAGLKAASSDTATIPILICTASRDLVDRHRALLDELGCETLDKPFNIDDLLGAIARCLTAKPALER
jgi:two-component system OmpR family response regulator